MIVITGPGRSGTSFLAMLYRELGFDPGGEWNAPADAGLEARTFAQTNRRLAAALGTAVIRRRWTGTIRTLDRLDELSARLPASAAKRASAALSGLRYRTLDLMNWQSLPGVVAEFGDSLRGLASDTQVVKDPRFCWTLQAWLASGAPVESVVLALRPLDAMVESRVRAGMITEEARTWAKNNFAYGIGLVMAAAVEYRVPVEIVRFPDFLDDPRDLYDRLPLPEGRSWEEFHAAFVELRDTSLVHDRR